VAITLPPDVRRMVEAKLASGRYRDEEQVLREALRALTEQDEDLEAVCEAISEWKAGDAGVPRPSCSTAVSDTEAD